MKSLSLLLLVVCVVLVSGKNISSPLASNCGGNCPSKDCESCPCGTTKSPADVESACSQFSGWDQHCCQCIARHESGGNLNAVNENTGGSYDVGLWQINSGNWAACSGNAAPCSLAANLNCAQYVWKQGGGTFKLWATCGACNCCTNPSNTGTHATNGPSGPSTTQSSYAGAVTEADLSKRGGDGSSPVVNVIFPGQ